MNAHIYPTSCRVERANADLEFSILHLNEDDSFVLVWFKELAGLKTLRDQITDYLDAQTKKATP